MIRPLRVAILLMLLLPAIARSADIASRPATPGLKIEHRTLDARDGKRVEAESGTLMVPENRAVAGSRLIPIRFLRLRSTAAQPKSPLFYLAGGPGDRGVSESPGAIAFWSRFLAVGDVVLIDQRGVGDPDLEWNWDGPLPLHFFVSADSALRHMAELNRRAAAAIRKRGVDLAGYNTVESAADLDALRAALGIERVSLLAFSYGTHLACAYLRAHDRRVDDVVMIGLEGPDQTYKLPWTMDTQFRKLALLAAGDPRIAGKVPDLMALYDRVIAKLSKQPMRVPVVGPGGKDTLQVPVGPFGLRYIMRFDIGDATDLPVFPRLLWSIDQGDPSVLAWFVNKRAPVMLGVSAMNEAMDTASGATRARRALIEEQAATSRFADVVNFPYPAAEAAWNVPDLGNAFRSPVVTSCRVLLLSGSLDFNTPPYQSEEFRWGAPNATHIVVPNAGHEQTFWQNETALPVVLDFLAGKDVKDRAITYPPLRFVPLEGSDAQVRHPSVR
jgi:pimeloyl-ACP methyl ester carboxylesterase